MACTTKNKFVDQLRFLASGQDDPQSVALTKAADEIERLRKGLERIADLQTYDEDGVNKYIVILAIGMAHETLVRREIDD